MTTKKEFIAKILEVGKGKPIDMSTLTTDTNVINQWVGFAEGEAIGFQTNDTSIEIDEINKYNPPSSESSIVFKKGRARINDIDKKIGIHAISKLVFLAAPQKQAVELTYSAKEALHGLQKDTEGIEWGGGIDFEIIRGRAQIERILAYFAEESEVPSRIIRKYADDVEVLFHTHPNVEFAAPSEGDIHAFIESKQQMTFISAGKEILILEKTRNTPETITEKEVSSKLSDEWDQPFDTKEQSKMMKEIEQKFKIRSTIIPYTKEKTMLDLNVIRNLQK